MPDNKLTDVTDNNVGKMTDNEIVKALECCALCKQHCPSSCPLSDNYNCKKILFKATLDLINRLQAEKSNLEIELKAMRGAANSYKAENDRLNKENIALNRRAIPSSGSIFKVGNALLFAENEQDLATTINTIKAEAYKEFAEKIKENAYYNMAGDNIVFCHEVDDLLKELVGDK